MPNSRGIDRMEGYKLDTVNAENFLKAVLL